MKYTSSLKPKLIYVFRINDDAHKGCLKIGEATTDTKNLWELGPNSKALNEAAKIRINQYTQTAGISYDLLYTEFALYNDKGTTKSFSDTEVHQVLIRSGIEKKTFDKINKANEWFVTDLETVKNAIKAVKEGRQSLGIKEKSEGKSPIIFRPEQKEAIDKTKKQFEKGNEMLWFAKMRFGKTLSALQVVKDLNYKRSLILTHRPVVDVSWFEDFRKIFYDKPNYEYGSKNQGNDFQTLEFRSKKEDTSYIYFASMHDLRGSSPIGGKFDKNDEVFKTKWDCLIIDEAHEGTQTELGRNVINELVKPKTKVLHLSGTPFNLLDNFAEDEIYTWDYVMEQRAKKEWDEIHFGDPNPYASLPKLNIFTYDIGKIVEGFIDEDVAFNFREFFRVSESGSFIHHKDVLSFLNLISKEDNESNYPYSTTEYRDNFRHSLWITPGVKEARALSSMLQVHKVFSQFKIVNVAGEGDEEEEYKDALKKVQEAISDNPHETYSITLSCGRLTTGVSVPAWTAVFMLSGSFNTSASSYMQTIFRVQTPAVINGRTKQDCFVFDFAPDRTLKVIAETAKISAKVGKTTVEDRKIMGEFLNFCPVISVHGSQMKTYNVEGMLEQLKKVYVERVVRNGFEDGYLYNNDELMKLNNLELIDFENLKGIIGSTKAMQKSGDIDINNQGFTVEEYEQIESLKKKKKKELSEEEKQLLAEKAEKKKNRDTAISILRGISIRMPLIIYGADVADEDKQINIDNFAELIDDKSWEEFMPKGVTKDLFEKFKRYYEPDVFRAAGKKIRALARAADHLSVDERIERITSIFGTFRNPDKETVLTPWRVVNKHLGDCLGGYVFLDDNQDKTINEPRFVSHGDVTENVFTTDARILEINSKSGLYPLYMAYSIFRHRLKDISPDSNLNTLSVSQQLEVWDKTVSENIFVICKTPMAKSITKRTLVGFRNSKINAHYFEDLVRQITERSGKFAEKVKKGNSYWKANNNNDMKFNAIVGNPPYQIMDGGGSGSSAIPIYNKFLDVAKSTKPDFISMIIPAKWYTGGKGLDSFRKSMLEDKRLRYLADYPDSRECFPTVDIAGGICYFLWDKDYKGICHYDSINSGIRTQSKRDLSEYDSFIRHVEATNIISKIENNSSVFLSSVVYSRNPFGLTNKILSNQIKFSNSIPVFSSNGTFYIKDSEIKVNKDIVPRWKVIISKTSSEHAGQTDKSGKKRVLSRVKVLPPNEVCSESYLLVNVFEKEQEALNAAKYLNTILLRFLLSSILLTQNIAKDKFAFVPLQDFSEKSDIDWSKSISEIDDQLYKKYMLTDEEIEFIESKIKPM